MTIVIRKSADRGQADFGWLQARYSFSFAKYHDPAYMGFGPLCVLNEDIVAPNGGFATHPHENMEIVTYVLSGALEHKDSMGNGSVIQAGDVQRMSAGTGVTHSEKNPSDDSPVHLLQIWLVPEVQNSPPSYAQQHIESAQKQHRWCLIVSKDGREGSITIQQDVDIVASCLNAGQALEYELQPGRIIWIQLVRGVITINGTEIEKGDGAAIASPGTLHVQCTEDAELLLFDMAEDA